MKKFIKPAIGLVAFVIGGIVAREQAFGAVESIDKTFHRQKDAAKQKAGEKVNELNNQARN